MRSFFQTLEQLDNNTHLKLDSVLKQLSFNEQGLIPIITQDVTSKAVLMMAWMNADALQQTLTTKRMTYWSRSRAALWLKGETSGHYQALQSMHLDCDGDAIVCQVEQTGAACHTGRPSCFYLKVDSENKTVSVQGNASKN